MGSSAKSSQMLAEHRFSFHDAQPLRPPSAVAVARQTMPANFVAKEQRSVTLNNERPVGSTNDSVLTNSVLMPQSFNATPFEGNATIEQLEYSPDCAAENDYSEIVKPVKRISGDSKEVAVQTELFDS